MKTITLPNVRLTTRPHAGQTVGFPLSPIVEDAKTGSTHAVLSLTRTLCPRKRRAVRDAGWTDPVYLLTKTVRDNTGKRPGYIFGTHKL